MAKFKRENRYIVIKRKDLIDTQLSDDDLIELNRICEKIDSHRRVIFKKRPREYVVVEKNWPEYEKVWGMIQKRTDQEQRAKDNLIEFAKNHPIVKQQERVERMEKALKYIKEYWSSDEELIAVVDEALKED